MTAFNSGFVLPKYAENAMDGTSVDVVNDAQLSVALARSSAISSLAVTAATNASPAVITTAAHGLAVNDPVLIVGALGNTAINGLFLVNTVPSGTTFTIKNLDGTVVAGNGAWTSGGSVFKLASWVNWSDVSAGLVGAITAIPPTGTSTRAITNGLFTHGTTTIPTVAAGAAIDFLFYLKNTGTAGTSTLIALAPISITPTGVSIDVTDANGAFSLSM